MSYTLRPAKGTTLYCIEKPKVGGDTMFANMYVAYETLSEKLRNFLDTLDAVHDVSLIEGMNKRDPVLAAEFRRLNPPVIHPAVRVHPETGRKALYVNERVRQFVGMTEEESRPLIRFLCEYSTSPRFVYRHRWRANDIVMWDNRCLIHVAVGDYDPSEARHMLRTTCFGDHYGRLEVPTPACAATPETIQHDMAVALGNMHD
jgi:taurine dioxygenase